MTPNLLLSFLAFVSLGAGSPVPDPGKASNQMYQARWISEAKIALDGKLDEMAWHETSADMRFTFPWKQAAAPGTEFRALWDETSLYFSFVVRDADLVALKTLRDEEDAVFEDRVEIYLSRDDWMHDYFCFEVDSRGRIFDYRASFHRKFDTKWGLKDLKASGSKTTHGYQVEGCIPLSSFETMGFPRIKPGTKIRCGLYRAEFSHDKSGKKIEQKETLHNLGRTIEGPPPIEEWISWVDPKTKEPEFHVPASLGWLEFTK